MNISYWVRVRGTKRSLEASRTHSNPSKICGSSSSSMSSSGSDISSDESECPSSSSAWIGALATAFFFGGI